MRPLGGSAGALTLLARHYGVQRSYTGVDGRRHRALDEAVVEILAALGAPLGRLEDAPEAWRATQAAQAATVLEPVVVHRPGEPRETSLTLPRGARRTAWAELCREDGTVVRRRLSHLAPGSDGPVHRIDLEGFGPLPPGYHRLAIDAGGTRAEAVVVAAPDRCPPLPCGWGLFSPLHALRGARDWGSGSFSDLAALGAWAQGLGAHLVATLPLYAGFLEGPHADPSPYRPASRLAWNEAYLDVEALEDLDVSPRARQALAAPGLRREAARLAAGRLASLPAVAAAKRRVLLPLAEDFFAARRTTKRHRSHQAWAAAHPATVAYARFRATQAAAAAGGRPEVLAQELAYHLYSQWAADEQLASAGARAPLYLDLPVGVHPDGFDPTWAPGSYLEGLSAGAPPDAFFAAGQVWGLAPLHPLGARRDGYRHVAEVLGQATRHAGVLRLDHVMGLHRLWVVPAGRPADQGAYVGFRAAELRAVAVLEAWRAGTALVGEDLGTVPAGVRAAMAKDGMARMSVWQFAATPDHPLPAPAPGTVASVGTHDLAPFARFVRSPSRPPSPPRKALPADPGRHPAPRDPVGEEDWRQALGPPRQALERVLVHLGASAACLVLVDLADLWLERVPQNRPGTTTAAGSFRLRARRSLAALQSDPFVRHLLEALSRARATRSGEPS